MRNTTTHMINACGLMRVSKEVMFDLRSNSFHDLVNIAEQINRLSFDPESVCELEGCDYTIDNIEVIHTQIHGSVACPTVYSASRLYHFCRAKLAEVCAINAARLAHRAMPF